jgi:hypothetical protein
MKSPRARYKYRYKDDIKTDLKQVKGKGIFWKFNVTYSIILLRLLNLLVKNKVTKTLISPQKV